MSRSNTVIITTADGTTTTAIVGWSVTVVGTGAIVTDTYIGAVIVEGDGLRLSGPQQDV